MKAVLLAGGFGTRLSEETGTVPKPLIEIGGRPILWHIMKIYAKHGIDDFIVCCGYKGEMIKERLLQNAEGVLDFSPFWAILVGCGVASGMISRYDLADESQTTGRSWTMPAQESLAVYWRRIQRELFPFLVDAVGPLSERDRLLVAVLEMAQVERFVTRSWGLAGRPLACRASLARAFVAKAVYELPTTTLLVDRLRSDLRLRRLCGWERVGELPSEATFSRAFAEFAASSLPERAHAAVIAARRADRLVGHISRDSSAIHARERPARIERPAKPPKRRKRGRPRKDEPRPPSVARSATKSPSRLERQPSMSLAAMLADLPRYCSIGTKQNAHT